jgi:O-antigen/teichoic acid export membrane protein
VTPEITNTETGNAAIVQGLTTRVVKGSAWTFAGQVIPLLVSLITTPFVIRLLGTEGYGVLIFLAVVPTFLAFADVGMGVAATKFGAEAYGSGDHAREARIVRTAAIVLSAVATPIAAILILFSPTIIELFNIPDEFKSDATLALRFAAITFVVTLLIPVFSSPQLARLRMDLTTLINSGWRIAGAIGTLIVLAWGGGLAAVTFVLMITAIAALALQFIVSGKLNGHLFGSSIEREALGVILPFGLNLSVTFIATSLLAHSEKLLLPQLLSVQDLAFYSVAFTFASMASMFSAAMQQSLLPAFSQLTTAERAMQLKNLYVRGLRLNVLILLPLIVGLAAVAKPFFTFWATEDFGRESTPAFYILLTGLLFNILAAAPYTLLLAHGRSQLLAKIYWGEVIAYIPLVFVLISTFGVIGAAISWSIRCIADAGILFYLATRGEGWQGHGIFPYKALVLGSVAFVPLVAAFLMVPGWYLPIIGAATVSLTLYCGLAWTTLIRPEERNWAVHRLRSALAMVRSV